MKTNEIVYLPIDKLRPHPDNAKIYGDAADEDLLKSMRSNGFLECCAMLVTQPGVLEEESVIIAGHRRFNGSQILGYKKVPVIFSEETDPLRIKKLLIELNNQRQKTDRQKLREGEALFEIEAELARRDQLSKLNHVKDSVVQVNSPEREKGQTRDIVAQKLGIGAQKLERGIKVIKKADALRAEGKAEEAEALEKMIDEKSVHAAYQQIKEEKKPPKVVIPEKDLEEKENIEGDTPTKRIAESLKEIADAKSQGKELKKVGAFLEELKEKVPEINEEEIVQKIDALRAGGMEKEAEELREILNKKIKDTRPKEAVIPEFEPEEKEDVEGGYYPEDLGKEETPQDWRKDFPKAPKELAIPRNINPSDSFLPLITDSIEIVNLKESLKRYHQSAVDSLIQENAKKMGEKLQEIGNLKDENQNLSYSNECISNELQNLREKIETLKQYTTDNEKLQKENVNYQEEIKKLQSIIATKEADKEAMEFHQKQQTLLTDENKLLSDSNESLSKEIASLREENKKLQSIIADKEADNEPSVTKEEKISCILNAEERYTVREIDVAGKGKKVKTLRDGGNISDAKLNELYKRVLKLDGKEKPVSEPPHQEQKTLLSLETQKFQEEIAQLREENMEVKQHKANLLKELEVAQTKIDEMSKRPMMAELPKAEPSKAVDEVEKLKQENWRLKHQVEDLTLKTEEQAITICEVSHRMCELSEEAEKRGSKRHRY